MFNKTKSYCLFLWEGVKRHFYFTNQKKKTITKEKVIIFNISKRKMKIVDD